MRILSIGMMYPPHDLAGGYERTWRSAVRAMRATGDEVRVLASDWRHPDASEELDDDVHRELRVYWRDHAFPRLSVRERLTIERANAVTLDRHLVEFSPDAVNWWQMGGMSLSLLERVRRAGIPAVGVVGDDWLNWGPRADGWIRLFRRRPRLGRVVEGLVDRRTWIWTMPRSGCSTAMRCGRAHSGSIQRSNTWRWRTQALTPISSRQRSHSLGVAPPLHRPSRPAQGCPRGDPRACGAPHPRHSGDPGGWGWWLRERAAQAGRRAWPAAASHFLARAAREACLRIRGGRRRSVPGAVEGAVGLGASRGDGGRSSRGSDGKWRLGEFTYEMVTTA